MSCRNMRVVIGSAGAVGLFFRPCCPAAVTDAVAVGSGGHRLGLVTEQALFYRIFQVAVIILDAAPKGFVYEAFQFVDLRFVWTEHLFHDGCQPTARPRLVTKPRRPCARFLRQESFGLVVVVDD